jgi:hypothetical protein
MGDLLGEEEGKTINITLYSQRTFRHLEFYTMKIIFEKLSTFLFTLDSSFEQI